MSDYILHKGELYHHGIKGMKWGVRRYQNPDGSLTPDGIKRYQSECNKQANKGNSRGDLTRSRTIPAGTKMYRTSTNNNETLNGSTYVSYLDVDRNHYKGGHIRYRDNAAKAYEYEYTLQSDLRLPSREDQQKIVNDVVRSNKKYLSESVKAWVDVAIPEGTWSRVEIENYHDGGVKKFIENSMKQWRKTTPEQLAYSVCQSMGLAPNVKKEVISELKKQGYNAMVDEASVGGRNGWAKEGYDPLIIFDSSVLSTDNVKQISKFEENRARNKDAQWLRKVNSSKNTTARWSAV